MTNWVAHDHSVSTVSFSPSGNTLATAPTNGPVRIWDLASQRAIQCDRHDCEFFSLAFSPDGRRLAGCGPNKDVWLWDTAKGQERLRLSGHNGVVGAVAFSPDGALLATSSYDGQVPGGYLLADTRLEFWHVHRRIAQMSMRMP